MPRKSKKSKIKADHNRDNHKSNVVAPSESIEETSSYEKKVANLFPNQEESKKWFYKDFKKTILITAFIVVAQIVLYELQAYGIFDISKVINFN